MQISPGEATLTVRRRVWQAGKVEYDESTHELRVHGERRPIEAKPLGLLRALLAQGNMVVTKDALLTAAWDKPYVGDGSLTTAISKLRAALGAEAHIIEAVHGVGYRIAVPVEMRHAESAPALAPALQPGDPVPGRPQWRLKQMLGCGRGNDVWLARHARTGEKRVFKFAIDAPGLDTLKREATISRLLTKALGSRDDFVPVREWNFERRPYFLEMSYAGSDLRAWAADPARWERLSLAARLALMADVASTVAAAHGAGVLHQDLKPANILVDERENGERVVRLVDFGAAGLAGAALTEAISVTLAGLADPPEGTRTGTLLYLAPERASGGAPSMAADVYALGVLLYQTLIGDFTRPLAPGWEDHVPDPILREDVAAAAAGEPARRPSAAALADRLRMVDERRADRARRATEAEHAARLAERERRRRLRRPWIMLASLSVLLGAASSGLAALHAVHERDEARRQAGIARSINLFLTEDLLGRGNIASSGKVDETLLEAAQAAEKLVAGRVGNEPVIAASLYLALAEAYDGRSAVKEARRAFDEAVAAFDKAEGRVSSDAAIASLRRAAMEARVRDGESLRTAQALIAQAEAMLPKFAMRQAEVRTWKLIAQAELHMANAEPRRALDAYRMAESLAETMPDQFDADEVLQIRLGEGKALLDAEQYAAARAVYDEVRRISAARHGPFSPVALEAAVEQANVALAAGENAACIDGIDAIYPDLVRIFGAGHNVVLLALRLRGGALGTIGRYAEAARDLRPVYEAAVASSGPRSFRAISALGALGAVQCRAGDVASGMAGLQQAISEAEAGFGARHAATQAMTEGLAECLVISGQYDAAGQKLHLVDRNVAAKVMDDPYPGATFDMLDAEISFRTGNMQRAGSSLGLLRKAFGQNGGDVLYRRWVAELTAALAQ